MMRTRRQFLDTYAQSHRNSVNQAIHLICVPVIFAATVGLAWSVPVGHWLPGLPVEWVPWVNLATLALLPVLIFYGLLGGLSFATGVVWSAISILGVVAIRASGLPLVWVSLAAWVAAWAAQFYGHHVEGAKPSFSDDLIFLLIGPLFVSDKIGRMLKARSLHSSEHHPL